MSAITFKPGMTEDLWMPYMLIFMLMTLTLVKGHSGSAKKISVAMLSATKQAISTKLATTVGFFFLRDLDLDFANVYYGLTDR